MVWHDYGIFIIINIIVFSILSRIQLIKQNTLLNDESSSESHTTEENIVCYSTLVYLEYVFNFNWYIGFSKRKYSVRFEITNQTIYTDQN